MLLQHSHHPVPLLLLLPTLLLQPLQALRNSCLHFLPAGCFSYCRSQLLRILRHHVSNLRP
jgi:hypothetical protein